MAYDDLREWIAALDRAGELKRIRTEADPILEITEIADRVSKANSPKFGPGGPALLFENIKGHPGRTASHQSIWIATPDEQGIGG